MEGAQKNVNGTSVGKELVKEEHTQVVIKSEVIDEEYQWTKDEKEENVEPMEEVFIKDEVFEEPEVEKECDYLSAEVNHEEDEVDESNQPEGGQTGVLNQISNDEKIPYALQRSILREHKDGLHEERPHSCCDLCKNNTASSDKPFSNKLNKESQSGVQGSFVCNLCGKSFNRKFNLQKHFLVHTGEKSFSCNICNKSFAHKSTLTQHIIIHTGGQSFSCDKCDREFRYKSNLLQHKRVHDRIKPVVERRERPFQCNICNKEFKKKAHLSQHILIHIGHKPFSCDICNKAFTYKLSLNYHIKVHEGQKPFSCDVCNKAFIGKSSLTVHMRVHTGQRPFTCGRCNKTFTRKCNLTKHLRVHIKQDDNLFSHATVVND